MQRPSMRFVPTKTIEQQDIQSLHRIRSQAVARRTALGNQIRGLLMEYGIIIPKGISFIRKQIPLVLEDAENGLTVLFRELLSELYDEMKQNQQNQQQNQGHSKIRVRSFIMRNNCRIIDK